MRLDHLHPLVRGLVWTAALALPAVALAEPAQTVQTANLRAGPGNTYPVVARLTPGVTVDMQGCNAGYQWCDVVLSDGNRGWVWAGSLTHPYQGRPVAIPQYGAAIGIPLITFALGSYWGSHYRDRPFYREPRYWGGRPPQFHGGGPGPRFDHRGPPPRFHGGPPPRPEFHGRPGGGRGGDFHRHGGGDHRGGGRGDRGGGHGGGHGHGGHR